MDEKILNTENTPDTEILQEEIIADVSEAEAEALLSDENLSDEATDEDEVSENTVPEKISRYKHREQTFLIVFESLFSDTDVDEIADNFTDSTAQFYSEEAINSAKIIQEMSEELDSAITAHLTKGWKINRISKISHAVLRVAVYEIKYCEEIPVSVSINEAVELTKKYSVTQDASFVNGLLGSLVKEQ